LTFEVKHRNREGGGGGKGEGTVVKYIPGCTTKKSYEIRKLTSNQDREVNIHDNTNHPPTFYLYTEELSKFIY